MRKEPKLKKCKICRELFTPQRPLQMVCGILCANKYLAKRKEVKEKMERKELKELDIKVNDGKWKKTLQDEINKLSREIDKMFGNVTCIDCDKTFGNQIDAAHYHSRGENSTLKYHLHNLHSARSDCNQYSAKHKQGYAEGLKSRYGLKYATFVIDELPPLIPYIKVTGKDAHEKLVIVRKLIRTLHTFKFKDAIDAREKCNKIIGIY